MRYILILVWLLVLQLGAGNMAAAAQWRGGTSFNSYGAAANWEPSEVPDQEGEAALFAAESGANCNLSTNVAPTTVTLQAGFAGTLTVSTGRMTCADLRLTSGTILSTGERFEVTRSLRVDGGTAASVSCSGNARLQGGLVSLRMHGDNASLGGLDSGITTIQELIELIRSMDDVSEVPTLLASLVVVPTNLQIADGTTRQSQFFAPLVYTLGAEAVHAVESRAALILTSHTISGRLELGQISGLVFTTGAGFSPTAVLDASTSGTVVYCLGDWSMPGTYIARGTSTSSLIIQQGTGGIINHGANPADLVVISGGEGAVSQWQSSNQLQSLTISAASTMRIMAGATVDVMTAIGNAGLVEIEPGGGLRTVAAATFRSEFGLPITTRPAGESFVVQLTEGDKNLDGTTPEVGGGLTVRNPRNGDVLPVEALETGLMTGIFQSTPIATVSASQAMDDDVLQVLPGDVLELLYVDPADPDDTATATLTIEVGSEPTGDGWQVH